MRRDHLLEFLFLLVLYPHLIPCTLIGVERLTKVFQPKQLFGFGKKDGQKVAINSLSLDFHPNTVHTLLGPSGCGKTTLMKILCGIDSPTSGFLKVASGADVILKDHEHIEFPSNSSSRTTLLKSSSLYQSILIDHKFSSSYSTTLCINDIEASLPTSAQNFLCKSYIIRKSEQARSLMESDRRILEVMLALSTLNIDRYGAVICIDEWIDKDFQSTHRKFSRFLRDLCGAVEFDLKIIISTHSRGVMQHYNDRIIVLNKGQLYHIGSGDIDKKLLPVQMLNNMIE